MLNITKAQTNCQAIEQQALPAQGKLHLKTPYKELHAKGYNFSKSLPKLLCCSKCRSGVEHDNHTVRYCLYARCQKPIAGECEAHKWALAEFERLTKEGRLAKAEPILKEPQTEREEYREFLRSFQHTGSYVAFGNEADNCGRWGMLKECQHGHKIVKRLLDGREWCPTCGRDNSEFHNRRKARLVDRVFCMSRVNYLIFEVPVALRSYFHDIAMLRESRRYIVRMVARELKVRGVSRWHYYGEPTMVEGEVELTRYHPHLNMLIEHGYIGKKQLRRIRVLWSRWLMRECHQERYRVAPVYTQYFRSPSKKWHLINYITRSTFKALNDSNRHIASELYGFNNCHWFGKFTEADKARGRTEFLEWQLTLEPKAQGDIELVSAHWLYNSGYCPVCGADTELVEGVVMVSKYEVLKDYGGGLYWVSGGESYSDFEYALAHGAYVP